MGFSPARMVLTAEIRGGDNDYRGLLLRDRRMGLGRRYPVAGGRGL